MALADYGFFPIYDSDIVEIDAGAVRLDRNKAASVDALLPEVETGFARINAQLRGVQRTLRTRMAELEAADRHIARLEEKVLKLKQAKRDLKQLKAEKQALRKSPERKVGQVLLAPYRLPQKLIREVRKQFGRPLPAKNPALTPNEYQKWLQARRPSAAELAAAREAAGAFASRPLVSIITPIYNTPATWLEEAIDSVVRAGLRKLGAASGRRRLDPRRNHRPPRRGRAPRSSHPCRQAGRHRRNFGRFQSPGWKSPAVNGSAFSITTTSSSRMPSSTCVKYLQTNPDTDLIFSDEDKITEEGFGRATIQTRLVAGFFPFL